MKLTLWNNEINYDEVMLKLKGLTALLIEEGKKSIVGMYEVGKVKNMGWGIKCWEYPPKEMNRVCNIVGNYVVQNNLLEQAPNWQIFIKPYVEMIEQGKTAILNYDRAALNFAATQARNKYQETYNRELANSDGLGFGILSNSLTSHLIYAAQATRKEIENQKKADKIAQQVWQANDPFSRSDLMTKNFYDETVEPYYVDVITNFYCELEKLIYKGLNQEHSSQEEKVENIAFEIGSIEDNKKLIIRGVSSDTYFADAIFFAIKTNLVDKDLAVFFESVPQVLKKNVQKSILDYLNEQKKNASLYNRDSLSNEVISIIKNTKLLYSYNITIYENIVDSLYKAEIKKVCQKFDDLLRVGNNPESLSAYAKTKRAITITTSDISLFLKYYEIFATEQMKKVVALIGSTEIDKFNKYLSSINEKIGVEYEKYQQEERERKAREEQYRRELEEKKRLIRGEIQSLNRELQSLGFALFGQKARRKAELKELILRKETELISLK